MRTIDTINKSKNPCLPAGRKNQSRTFSILPKVLNLKGAGCSVILIFAVCSLILLGGCGHQGYLQNPQDYAQQSQRYYQLAVAQYKGLIKEGKDLDRLYFELGNLYYNHGDYEEAQEALKKSNDIQAKKFLAISYYRLGSFTDALEIFNKSRTFSEVEPSSDKKVRDKQELSDNEYLYYHGLTCEKLNLFDQALEIYKKINATERINIIEKQTSSKHIKNVSPQGYKILSSAPSVKLYPQAGALILYCDERIEITPENTQISYLHYIVKILNERGKEDFAEIHIDYDSTYEKVELEYARTIKPNGEVVEVGTRHIRDVSKYLNFPLYSNVHAFIISFPEIAEGASIEYKLKVYDNHLINKKDFVLSYPVQAGEPIIAANFNIQVPKNKLLHIKTLNEKYNNFGANLKPKIKEENGSFVYHWQFKDIPQIIPETSMPPNVEINPTILLSTFNSWQEIYQWWWALARNKIKPDKAIEEKVRQLIKNQPSEEAKIRQIYNFCAKEIRYVAVEYGEAGYEPHYAADIFKNKYGDCKDQSILLITMLKEAGFTAWPVLIATREYYDLNRDFPAVLFNHCIAAVNFKEELVFLDPTLETCPFQDLPAGDEGRKVLISKEDGYTIENTPLYPAEHNLVKQFLKLKINPDESIAAQKTIFTYGLYDQAQRFWFLYTPPQLIEESLKEKIQGVSIGATLEKYEIKNLKDLNQPIVLSYALKGPEYFTAAGNLRIMPQLTGQDTAIVAKDKRKYPIDFGILESEETNLEIELPANFAIKYMPESISVDSPWLKFAAEYKHKASIIYFKQKTDLKKLIVSESEYPEFKKFLEGLAKRIKQRIILERIK